MRTEAYDKTLSAKAALEDSAMTASYYEEGPFNHFVEVAEFRVAYKLRDGSLRYINEVRRLGYDAHEIELDLRGTVVKVMAPVESYADDVDCCPSCKMAPKVIKYEVLSRDGTLPAGAVKATMEEIDKASKMNNRKRK